MPAFTSGVRQATESHDYPWPGLSAAGGSLYAAIGVMGAVMQPQGHLQVRSSTINDGLNTPDRSRSSAEIPTGEP